MNMRATVKALGAALVAVGLVVSATSARADVKCRRTVAKESAKLTQSIAKSLQKCEQKVLKGDLTPPCPDPDSATSIGKAKSKLQAKIADKCETSTGEFAFGKCPNETGPSGSCGNILIQSKNDVGACLACLAEHNAVELVQKVLYGASINPPGSKDIANCQKAVGQETTKFYVAKSKAMQKCHDGVLKGDIVGACPDTETAAVIDEAESKKVSKITKKCCGDDEVCGGATCSASSPGVICTGGANAGVACSDASQCPGGTCTATAAGDACEADSDCGRCRGGTTAGEPCRASGQCQSDPGACNPLTLLCVGGVNDGDPCTMNCVAGANAGAACTSNSACPGSICGNCPSIASGTCVGTSGLCGGVDDLRPIQDIGFPSPCPGLTLNGAPIVLTGQTGASLLQCVDTQADERASCQDAAGATFASNDTIPPFCVDSTQECVGDGGPATVTVSITTPASLGGISISLGYQDVMIPGSGDLSGTGRVTNLQTGLDAESDTDDTVITSITDFGGLIQGPLYSVQFNICHGAGTPTTGDFGCVVRSASDVNGVEVIDGVSCQVTSIS